MANTTTLIREKLTTAFNPLHLTIKDDSEKHAGHAGAREGSGHFTVIIVSAEFVEKTLIQRHRLVYSALDDLMKTAIHALSIQAKTPDEFAQ